MSVGNTKDQGNKGNNFPYQLRTLQLLSSINDGIAALPGVDYETRTSTYQAIANGPGYSTGDILIRYDIIDVATSSVISIVWFNDTLQTTIAPPAPGDITPVSSPSSVTVINGPAGAAVNIQDGGNSITVDDGGTPLGINVNDGSGNPISSTGTSLDVNITNTIPLEVNISQANDSILIYGFDGSANQPIATSPAGVLQVDILSIPTVDVNIISSIPLDVQATDLDIRDLVYTSDSVTAYQGGGAWDVSGSNVLVTGIVGVTQDLSSNPWIIDGTVAATQSGTWTIDSITNSVVVTATDLDIRDLTFATDSIDVSNSTNVDVTNVNLDVALSTLGKETTLTNIYNNVFSKIERIKGAANYNRAITYVSPGTGDFRINTILHTGTTLLGAETLTETFTYYLATDNVTNIQYT